MSLSDKLQRELLLVEIICVPCPLTMDVVRKIFNLTEKEAANADLSDLASLKSNLEQTVRALGELKVK